MFADDIANGAESVVKLQQQINVIDLFCQQTGMQVNTDKTKVLVFEMAVYYDPMRTGLTKRDN